MKYLTVSILLFAINNFVNASESHRHYHGIDSKTKKPCELMVEHEYFVNDVTTKENYRALILTSYTVFDDDHQHFDEVNHVDNAIMVQFSTKNPKALTGTAIDKSAEIAILLNTEASTIDNPKSFNIKRKHGNHYHVDSCINLELADHE